jgi:cyclic-di-AMP phosphodiesterase PgpH
LSADAQELAIVKESFANTLRSMLHSRIDYPKDDERSSTGTKKLNSDRDTTQGGRVIPMPKRA